MLRRYHIALPIFLFAALSVIALSSNPASSQGADVQLPPNSYLIMVHYDLGMHCTGFDLSYCCVLPPYNSILAQVVRTATGTRDMPATLTDEDMKKQGWVLWYEHENNTYSEGPKMLYWNVPYDVNGNGILNEPNDSFANAEFMQLFTYGENPLGYKPENARQKLFVGRDINIPMDHGPTGKPVSHGTLDYTGEKGTIVYTNLNDGNSEIAIPLTQSSYWEALGLPLTAFYDGSVGNIRMVTEDLFRPYQKAVVTLARWRDDNHDGRKSKEEMQAVLQRNDEPVAFFGTNPIDAPSCDRCHASGLANRGEFSMYKKEYDFWKNTFPNTSDYYARVKAASISMFEIHDRRNGTNFLKEYNPLDKTGAAVTRLGRGPIKCQECHADNIIGVLGSAADPRTGQKITPLTTAVHLAHLREGPQPDAKGRAANCQSCHPHHNQAGTDVFYPMDKNGNFRGGDIRDYPGGCFIGRDIHSNPERARDLRTVSHLNAIGEWMKENVMADGKGLYCTNCHNTASRLLYKYDVLADGLTQEGNTLRGKSINEIVSIFRTHEGGLYRVLTEEDFFDPKVVPDDRVSLLWKDASNEPYRAVDDGGDYWLAAGEPHCADCHRPPFVEGLGGDYFPVDQEKKYTLMRYSKGHHDISCQSCHESTHGMHPVYEGGADPTTFAQAAQLNPDGSHGPLVCGACHAVGPDGVPTILDDAMLLDFPDSEYPTRYEKAVAFAHIAR